MNKRQRHLSETEGVLLEITKVVDDHWSGTCYDMHGNRRRVNGRKSTFGSWCREHGFEECDETTAAEFMHAIEFAAA